jgi:hypothetical protein
MKLYTEEQVKSLLNKMDVIYSLEDLTPIELPSDEEIKNLFPDFDEFDYDDVAYVAGAIWMRNKIQGSNK